MYRRHSQRRWMYVLTCKASCLHLSVFNKASQNWTPPYDIHILHSDDLACLIFQSCKCIYVSSQGGGTLMLLDWLQLVHSC